MEDQEKNTGAWSWKSIWQSIGALAAVLAIVYAPYAFMWQDLRGEIRGLRGDLRGEIWNVQGGLQGEIRDVQGDLRGEIRDVSGKIDTGLDTVNERLDTMDEKLANIDKRLGVVEDRMGIHAPREPAQPVVSGASSPAIPNPAISNPNGESAESAASAAVAESPAPNVRLAHRVIGAWLFYTGVRFASDLDMPE